MEELNRKRKLNAAAEVKRAEIALAQRYGHQVALARFLRTAAQPRLYWSPARQCADTILLQEQSQLELAVWLVRARAALAVAALCFDGWRHIPLPLLKAEGSPMLDVMHHVQGLRAS